MAAIGFLSAGIAIVGIAAAMFAPNTREDEADEDKRDEPQDPESEQVAEQTDAEAGKTVFSTPNGKTWHADRDCPRLRRSKDIKELEMSEAFEAGMKPCGVCGE